MAGAVTAVRLGVAPNRSRRRKLTSHDAGHIDTGRVVACAYAVCVGAVALGEASRRAPGIASMPSRGWAPTASPKTRGGSPPRAVPAVEALDAILGDGPARDAGAALGAAVGAYLWVKLFDVLASKKILERKLSRKVIHTTSGPFFALTWPLFSSSPAACYFAACVPALQAVRLFGIGSGLIKNENAVRAVSREGDKGELLKGPLIYTIVLVVTTAMYWRGSPEGVAALALMCGGDGMADIVGRRLGAGNKLPFNEDKSAAGSLAFFIVGFGMSVGFVALFHHLGYMEMDAGAAAGRLAVLAAACTVAEALPVTGVLDDNISVPVLALVLGSFLFH